MEHIAIRIHGSGVIYAITFVFMSFVWNSFMKRPLFAAATMMNPVLSDSRHKRRVCVRLKLHD